MVSFVFKKKKRKKIETLALHYVVHNRCPQMASLSQQTPNRDHPKKI